MEPSLTQKNAIEYLDGPCIISAGAGSGKTFTLINKFMYLVNKGYNPERILCFTFTNKAATELKERIIKFSNVNWWDIKWVRTIHSACLQMLKPYVHKINYLENVSIYSASEQRKIIREILIGHKLNAKKFTMPLSKLISDAKDNTDPHEYINKVRLKKYEIIQQELLPIFQHDREILIDIFNQYRYVLKRNNAIDYDDILFYTLHLLITDEEFKNEYKNYFQYILVDEFQDINNTQYQIIINLTDCCKNLTIVGDDFQSIFGWRGAKPEFFIDAKDKIEDSKLFKLEENYRSSTNIVNMSNDIIKKNTNQIPKVCYSNIISDIKPIIIKFKNDELEADNIAKICLYYVDQIKCTFDDIAILYRAKFISRAIEKALTNLGIPYTIIGSVAFFERREIKDIMAYIKFAFNINDTEAFARSINVPKRGIGKGTIQKILNQTGDNVIRKIKNFTYSTKINSRIYQNISKYYKIILSIIDNNPSDSINLILKEINFDDELRSMSVDDEDYVDRKENINELLKFASKFQTISDFINESSLMTSEDQNNNVEKVKLMTVHSAKGLEFKIVFIIGLEDGLFPHWKSLKSDCELKTTKHLEEERRLFYVATTRSKEILNMTTVEKRTCSFSGKRSRFLNEINSHCKILSV
ncbi:ATP-dependent helicase [archaeon]|jgi:DNA helicase II / ATP-dependent DNA helicase PcrA|nr:ATP-dependent helicase [archaeon]MBT7192455.1 ATP-dependent helicase [archaeon]